ncbi:YfmQ family protein [Neobacillus niacini]|uniref:YfmQ family protein n=1 Tax=Neobacillus niacini TaxID=86668 RepID=UPI0005F03FCB|nr:YfmQ family protein [Neobacillus niacini]
MTWTIALLVLLGIVIKMVTSPPSAVVKWITSKFALHPKLNSKDVTVTYIGEHFVEEEKNRFIDYFNEATFLKQYDIFPGKEKLFLHPETHVTPFVINVKRGKKDSKIFVYCFADYVYVVKQYKKKVVAYNLRSDNLQKFTISTKIFSKDVI